MNFMIPRHVKNNKRPFPAFLSSFLILTKMTMTIFTTLGVRRQAIFLNFPSSVCTTRPCLRQFFSI